MAAGLNRCQRCGGPLGRAIGGVCPACRQGVARTPVTEMLREAREAHRRHAGVSRALDRLTLERIKTLEGRQGT